MGDWPRDVKFFQDYLFVANERSNEICVLDASGKLISRIDKKGVNYICIMKEEF